MILGDPDRRHIGTVGQATLDDLFRRACESTPDAIALCDPTNRASITGGKPRRLTYAQADRAITAIAGRLQRLGLGVDTVVALQLANTVESVVTLLGVLRAGMIAAPLPLLWRRQECAAALTAVGAKAIVTTSHIGSTAYGDLAIGVAADVFAIRYVCSFGPTVPDGTIPMDDVLADDPLLEYAASGRDGNPAAHVAVVTFDVTPQGLVAVGRSHAELIAGGAVLIDEGPIERDSGGILACCLANSFAGITAGLVSWLLAGGTLILHHPFDAAAFAEQCGSASTVVVPGALTSRLELAGLLTHPGLRHVVALWRAPERVARADVWTHPEVRLTDALVFGENASICVSRGPDGRPAHIPLGPVFVTGRNGDRVKVSETSVTETGTLAIHGNMIPASPFRPGLRAAAGPGAGPDGFTDTGYPCRIDRSNGSISITAPPPGLVTVGGYRFRQDDLQSIAASLGDAVLTALPDSLAGHRLAGESTDRVSIQQGLTARGFNPLIVGAFGARRRSDAA